MEFNILGLYDCVVVVLSLNFQLIFVGRNRCYATRYSCFNFFNLADDEEDYEENGGSNRLLGFMFGNVDNSGDLDVDYLDEVIFVLFLMFTFICFGHCIKKQTMPFFFFFLSKSFILLNECVNGYWAEERQNAVTMVTRPVIALSLETDLASYGGGNELAMLMK